MGNIVDSLEDTIQNAILNAINCIFTPQIKLAIMSINASSGRDATNFMANLERGERIGITAPLKNVSERTNTLHVFNTDNETRNIFRKGKWIVGPRNAFWLTTTHSSHYHIFLEFFSQ